MGTHIPIMSRRRFMASSAAALAAAAPRVHAASSGRRARPHILLLMADQFRADCMGVAGNRAIATPHLDRIAAGGVRFSCAYSCTPTCTPARAALLTGLGPWRNGLLGYGRVGEKYPVEMPAVLRSAGYYTCGIGKMHWHPQRNAHGFEQLLLDESGRAESPEFRSDYRAWFASEAPGLNPDATGIGWNSYQGGAYALPERLHPTHWMGETAVRFLETYNRPDPFFLKVSFARPHSPYDPPKRFLRKYRDSPIPPASIGGWAAGFAKRSGNDDSPWHGDLGAEQVRRSRQAYYGSVSFVDEQIGRILDLLEKRGWLDDTLILFTADHGDMLGDHHLWRKSYAYEASAHIPMLLRWPNGLPHGHRGTVCGKPVELRDVLPALMEAAQAPGAGDLDGRSLLGLVRNPQAEWRPFIDLEHDICYAPENHWNALTDGEFKYIFHAMDGREQCFDLRNDPHETHDLAADPGHRARCGQWRARLVEHLAPRGDAFVKDGALVARSERMLYSPLYPGCSCHPNREA